MSISHAAKSSQITAGTIAQSLGVEYGSEVGYNFDIRSGLGRTGEEAEAMCNTAKIAQFSSPGDFISLDAVKRRYGNTSTAAIFRLRLVISEKSHLS